MKKLFNKLFFRFIRDRVSYYPLRDFFYMLLVRHGFKAHVFFPRSYLWSRIRIKTWDVVMPFGRGLGLDKTMDKIGRFLINPRND